MSTPAGQSLEHALQLRQRSSTSRSSGDRQSFTSVPLASSCSTRARPRVTSFSSPVAWYDGHMKPPSSEVSARHLPTPTQRCTALVKSPPSRANEKPVAALIGCCLLYTSDAADDLLC